MTEYIDPKLLSQLAALLNEKVAPCPKADIRLVLDAAATVLLNLFDFPTAQQLIEESEREEISLLTRLSPNEPALGLVIARHTTGRTALVLADTGSRPLIVATFNGNGMFAVWEVGGDPHEAMTRPDALVELILDKADAHGVPRLNPAIR